MRKIQTVDRPFCSPAAQSQARVIPLFYDSTVQIPSPSALEACFGNREEIEIDRQLKPGRINRQFLTDTAQKLVQSRVLLSWPATNCRRNFNLPDSSVECISNLTFSRPQLTEHNGIQVADYPQWRFPNFRLYPIPGAMLQVSCTASRLLVAMERERVPEMEGEKI
ncbi:hypothetical protein [Tychonema sp. LEGE 07203]|uniref:hypothetical protein n=1 Tax=Tychonema sp. LEGE 07203 TaxID=1828671 RepID=UPI0018805E27|nr:hypothetical protein [Tychonema sp. LEGE 07203]MBE9094954.1 hypothetical protein [Tychonema sp. LEGE 07203]